MNFTDKFFKWVSSIVSILLVIAIVFMSLTVIKFKFDPLALDFFGANDIVKNIENLELNMTSVIYAQDAEGNWVEYKRLHGDENRIWVSLDKMPKNLINAVVAIEDKRFFKHTGVDWKRTGAAFLNWLPNVNILSGNQGGSTLTQQLIKNITSDNDQNASRKAREIARALTLEKLIDKNTILEAYLNTISLGNGICGVQVASNYYFNKDVSELSLEECACIAGITKNPSAYNPIAFPEKNLKRRNLVLDAMYEQKFISYNEYSEAYNKDIILDDSQQNNFEIPVNNYFVDALIENIITDLSEKYNCSIDTASSMLYNGGYKIYSTVDTNIQGIMENVYINVPKYFSQKRNGENVQSSMTIIDYSGHVVGIVGGVGEKTVNRGLNRATSAPRQPGSTMKPLGVYSQALDNGTIYYTSVIEDKPLEKYYKDGKPGPKEWYGYYAGNMTIAKALERSANTIPCHILKDLGVENSYKFLTEKIGMKHLVENDKNISALALGGCSYGMTSMESAAAYAIFGNGGKFFEPKAYYKVEDSHGNLILNTDIDGNQVIKADTATLMNKLLQNVVYGSQGTGGGIRSYSKMKAYAKTGTSSESNDLWMVAGTPYYVGSVWYGFDNNGTIRNQAAAATVWKAVMTEVHKNLPFKEFEALTEIKPQKCCRYTGKLKGKHCYSTVDGYFPEGITPEVCDGKHTSFYDSSESSTSSSSQAIPPSQTSSSPASSSVPSESSSSSSASETSSEAQTSSESTSSSTPSQTTE